MAVMLTTVAVVALGVEWVEVRYIVPVYQLGGTGKVVGRRPRGWQERLAKLLAVGIYTLPLIC